MTVIPSEDSELHELISQLLRDRPAHVRYFHGIRGRLPAHSSTFHSQRLLVLYLSLVGADLLGDCVSDADGDALLAELRRCYDSATGGFCAEPPDDYGPFTTLTMTHCAVISLCCASVFSRATDVWLDRARTTAYVCACQVQSHPFGDGFRGAFCGAPGVSETDVRFSYSALITLAVLHAPLPLSAVPALRGVLADAAAFALRCWDPREGGFGAVPGAASHGGMTFCAVAALCLAGAEARVPKQWRRALCRFASARAQRGPQAEPAAPCGFQGRAQKDCDTCYAHWIGAALRLVAPREPLVDPLPVAKFISSCADGERGGVRKCVGVAVDPLHACLGLSGLLLQLEPHLRDGLRAPHPLYGCSWETARAAGLPDLVPPLEYLEERG